VSCTCPRLGRVPAAAGFRLVAAMNPFDAVGTARISGAVYDRVCRLSVGYQSAGDECEIVFRDRDGRSGSGIVLDATRTVDGWSARWSWCAVRGRTRTSGSVPRCVAPSTWPQWRRRWVSCAGVPTEHPGVCLDAALVALSGRVRLREGCQRTSEDIITELWHEVFDAPEPEGADPGSGDDAAGGGGKAPAPTGATRNH
jgi:MoxR-like ATPase